MSRYLPSTCHPCDVPPRGALSTKPEPGKRTFEPVPKLAAEYPPVAENLKQARLTFYCINCYRKAPTTWITPNFGPVCEACVTEAKL